MKKQENEDVKDNVVAIASRGEEVYNNAILKKLQYNDQIIISCLDRYLPFTINIIKQWEAVGILPEEGKIVFVKTEDDLFNKETQEYYNQPVNKITLTKSPEIFRFTKQ